MGTGEIDWKRAQSLFLEARELPESEREAFLASRCGAGDALRDAVENLLTHDDQEFLGSPALGGFKLPVATTVGVPRPHPERIGCYEITGFLGEGASGVVYCAEGPEEVAGGETGRVAIKVLRRGQAYGTGATRFQQEIEALQALDHPGIASVVDAGTLGEDEVPWFAMELIDGAPLGGETTPIDTRARLQLLAAVARAVGHAHERGIVHRDLKPANILVDRGVQPKIVDFGVARVESSLSESLTMSGHLLGTLPYMSPAQLRGSRGIDAQSDVYALGVVAYELLTGHLPYPDEQLDVLIQSVCAGRAKGLRRWDPSLPLDLETVIHCALDPDPRRRYQSAAALASDLESVLTSSSTAAQNLPLRTKLRRLAAQHRGVVLAAACVLIALVAGVTGVSLALHEAVTQREIAERRLVDLDREKRNVLERERAEHSARRDAEQAEKRALTVAKRAEEKWRRSEKVGAFFTGLAQIGRGRSALDVLLQSVRTIPKQLAKDPTAEAEVSAAVAVALWQHGARAEGQKLLRRADQLACQSFGAQSPQRLLIAGDLNLMLINEGKRGPEAAREHLRVMRQALGRSHALSVRASKQYIQALSVTNRLAEGLEEIAVYIELAGELHGAGSAVAMDARCSYAQALVANGDYEAAERFFAETRRLAAESAHAVQSLAMVDYVSGHVWMARDLARAKGLLERSLAGYARLNPGREDGELRMKARQSLGICLTRLKDFIGAHSHLLAAYRGQRQAVGDADLATLTSCYNLAAVECQLGAADTAVARLEKHLDAVLARKGHGVLRREFVATLIEGLELLGRDDDADRVRGRAGRPR